MGIHAQRSPYDKLELHRRILSRRLFTLRAIHERSARLSCSRLVHGPNELDVFLRRGHPPHEFDGEDVEHCADAR